MKDPLKAKLLLEQILKIATSTPRPSDVPLLEYYLDQWAFYSGSPEPESIEDWAAFATRELNALSVF